jgi:hypothetical protein
MPSDIIRGTASYSLGLVEEGLSTDDSSADNDDVVFVLGHFGQLPQLPAAQA